MVNSFIVCVASLSLALGAGCSAGTTPSGESRVSITVDEVNLEYFDAPARVGGFVTVTLRNVSESDLWFQPCGSILDRRLDDSWLVVWHSMCELTGSTETRIRPGGSHTTRIAISGSPGQGTTELWSAPIQGDYRIRIAVRDAENVIAEPERTSPLFRLPPS